jgi:flavin reductase (DIM6/NTAB) family NADH-FMN oxidoreductase RutF
MVVEPAEFRQALSQFASGVTVVTTRDREGRPLGLTVSAFCSVSLEPPLVLVCVDLRSDTNPGFEASGVFGVSVLAEHQRDLSERFAYDTDKFAGPGYVMGENGVVLVQGAVAHLECVVVASHGAGDHTIYVGEVQRVQVRPGRPLVYQGGAYRRIVRLSEGGS